jgi:hypothetical protein
MRLGLITKLVRFEPAAIRSVSLRVSGGIEILEANSHQNSHQWKWPFTVEGPFRY